MTVGITAEGLALKVLVMLLVNEGESKSPDHLFALLDMDEAPAVCGRTRRGVIRDALRAAPWLSEYVSWAG